MTDGAEREAVDSGSTTGDGGESESSAVTRREALATGTATAALAVAGCIGGGGGPLTISTWSGTNEAIFRNTIKPLYEEETGNDLEVVGNWTNILGQIRQSPSDDPPFDVTVGSVRDHYFGNQDGLWEPVRYENVPNADDIKPAVAQNLESDDGVPLVYGVMAYAYDADAVGTDPGSWRDLVTDGRPENFTVPGGYFLNSVIMGAIVADEAPMAAELYSSDQRDVDTIFETLSQMPISNFYNGASDMWTKIRQGVADAGQYFYAYSVAKQAETDDDELNIGVHVPERTVGTVDHYQVVRGTNKRTQAEELVNFLLREDVQTAWAEAFNVGTANENATHPERTRENVPLENDELEERVVFKKYEQIAEEASGLNERFKQFQNQF
jgi:hypothetical protein